MANLRVAVDVGGTFTDICIFDESTQSMRVTKVPSTPDNPMTAVINGVRRANIDLTDVELFSHGTTVATNALITRKFPKAALVTTKGFRDVIEIRDGTKDDLWDAYSDVSGPYIRRRDRFEVPERIDFAGNVVTALDEDAARDLGRLLRRRGVNTVAVCFINSYANPEHEIRMREILAEELPGANISTSAEVLPEIFELGRFNTTVANAVLGPLVSGYVERLDRNLRDDGYAGELLLLHSGGGSMTSEVVKRFPVRLAASGIAAGAIAAQHVAEQCGFSNAVGLDMGGTSTDISLIADGELRETNEWQVEYGHPIVFPSIEVLTIGAGGGSLAHIDIAGSLRNGPQSAGADPGPACYRRGGTEPTNTDANLWLGRLGTDLADGEMTLDRASSQAAIESTIATPLGLGTDAAADSIIKVANANMADAVRLVSIRRGLDPRDFALIAFGGAGALHGADVAKELDIPTVIVPPSPGVTSALGCLLVDIQHDLSQMYTGAADAADADVVEEHFRELELEGRTRLRHEKVAEEDAVFQRGIAMRYQGQWRSLQVKMGSGPNALEDAVQLFHEEHEKHYAFRQDETPVEIYQLHLKALGKTPKPSFKPSPVSTDDPGEPIEIRDVHFDGTWHRTPVYQRENLPSGAAFIGPAILNQIDSTTVIPPEASAVIDEWFNIRISLPTATGGATAETTTRGSTQSAL
ncbi:MULTISPECIES: hydantoinase/oxoprolinase family protein [unclassified Brevibacterium]|uniref:hydantoinase/oxoprolinase family protein n=1 Tax=unclassified Brevibacterium TaxID=2614124 RepID=UPI001BA51675|nr:MULTISPECIES: hydantoinase/oxoprolinase family protein [unclassified Brevibacterium]QUL78761.1 hydantoinase/oxoprolinase family protein [Brevibacterium sp. SMBL_HHYL_HB1]HJA59885.1 hydantoinase/oxoprolinase family protein [Candidatus Brevibacterium intestinavium]